MTREEFYRKIVYFNDRIDRCNSMVLLNEISGEFRNYTRYFQCNGLYNMQVPYDVEFAVIRLRIAERFLELRKEIECDEIDD